MDSQEHATLRNIEFKVGRIKNALEDIKALLIEIRDNTKPPATISITTFSTAMRLYDTPDGPRPQCNCGKHQTGELTGGWICPIHGHQN